MKINYLVSIAFMTVVGFAGAHQDSAASAASRRYDDHRHVVTEPPYGLSKVKHMVAKIKADKNDSEYLTPKLYNSLSLKEKFTYCMLHAEDQSQNCNYMPPLVNEEHLIFAYPTPAFYDQASWSKRQLKFLHDNRAEIVQLLRTTIKAKRQVGSNFNSAILELNAYELIPDLVTTYNLTKRNQDILSSLMTLMKNGGYKPFLKQPFYAKLYGANASYQAVIEASPAHVRTIANLALAYRKSRHA